MIFNVGLDQIMQESEKKSNINGKLDEIKNLNLRVLIEGIERQDELEIAKSLNCDFAQGFYLGKPCCLKDFLLLYKNYS